MTWLLDARGSAAVRILPATAPSPSAPPAPAELPDPELLATNLARSVVEVLAGARDLDQIARWIDEDVYRHLLARSQHAARARQLRRAPAMRPSFRILSTRVQRLVPTVAEAVVLVDAGSRVRAVALRLAEARGRWRASSVSVL